MLLILSYFVFLKFYTLADGNEFLKDRPVYMRDQCHLLLKRRQFKKNSINWKQKRKKKKRKNKETHMV